tara:strand:- start:1203 stop:3188 length:1986 start_codon:yes stop_codon:yes gene_type:complete
VVNIQINNRNKKNSRNILLEFLCSLPCWWFGFYALEHALIRSKEPKWFLLYSDEKLLFLIGAIIACTLWIKYATPLIIRAVNISSFRPPKLDHLHIFLLFASISSLLHLNQGMRVGEDLAGQVQSSHQYIEGFTKAPNYCSYPKTSDLSQNTSTWSPRPPVASWITLPGLYLGMSIGDSLRLILFILQIYGGIGWLKLSDQFKMSTESLILIALILGTGVGHSTIIFGTMNCVLLSLVPWMIIWVISITRKLINNKSFNLFLLLKFLFLSLCLGFFCVIKLSGMIAALSIAIIPIIYIFFYKNKISGKIPKIIFCFISVFIVLVPYKLLEKFNEKERAVSSDEMYRSIDYNQQSLLWGNYFEESTRGPMLLWSTLGAPGYALPGKKIAHGFRDLINQFDSLNAWLDFKKFNPHSLICGFIGFLLTLLLCINLWMIRSVMSYEFKIVSIVFFTIPFIGLAAVSFLHGFNYTLYSSHTVEYAMLLSLPVCHSLFLLKKTYHITTILLSGICFATPLASSFGSLIAPALTKNNFQVSETEEERGFAARNFSAAIKLIEEDSQYHSDILFFLPSGDLGDLYLRTRLRTLGLHFAGGNLPKAEAFLTSKPLIVYCAYSVILRENQEFQKALKLKFPQSISSEEISEKNKNVVVIKIHLAPDDSVNG